MTRISTWGKNSDLDYRPLIGVIWQHVQVICHAIYQSDRKSCANRASFLAPAVGLSSSWSSDSMGRARYVRVIRITGILLLRSLSIPGLRVLCVIDAILAMDGRKPQVPSRGLAIRVRTEVRVLDTSQCGITVGRALLKKWSVLEATRGSFVGSNGHEGHEVREQKAQQRRLQVTCACLEQFLQSWMIFLHDRSDTTNSKHQFFDVVHFQSDLRSLHSLHSVALCAVGKITWFEFVCANNWKLPVLTIKVRHFYCHPTDE